jgi:hypothetical protein
LGEYLVDLGVMDIFSESVVFGNEGDGEYLLPTMVRLIEFCLEKVRPQ